MSRPVLLVAVEVAAVVLLGFAFLYQPPSASYGIEAERLNESDYFEENVRNVSEIPERHRVGVRDAIETGHGSARGGTASDLQYRVRYEDEVYMTFATTVADPGPRPPWGFLAGTGGVALLAGRVLHSRYGG